MVEPAVLCTVDVAVIGAGIVGLGIAWAVAESGRTVAIIDPAPASGATYAAAGMLAAVSELHYKEEDLLELTLASAALYPDFVRPLSSDTGDTGYRMTRTLVVGADAADRQALADLRGAQLAQGLSVTPLRIREARALEPMLSSQLSGAFSVDDDHQVDPRRLAAQLLAAIKARATLDAWAHDHLIRQNAIGLLHSTQTDAASRVTGVSLVDGSTVRCDEVIVANGLGAANLDRLPAGLKLPLRPVYGDILRLRVPEHLRPLLTATIRGVVRGLPVYLVPRSDGTIVLGATSREDGSSAVSAGGVHRLLRDAQVLVPAVAELELVECTARARPGTPDNAPLLGRVSRRPVSPDSGPAPEGRDDEPGEVIPGLIVATGFFRHGVLLTPIAAQVCVQLLDGFVDARWLRFRPDRYSVPSESAAPIESAVPATPAAQEAAHV
ncbi:glycine oxidase ThiO [Cryobacterium psychrophilum]|uniref:glycine oxidase n=1 Tax=Cryobacterium psychrophilum TaxID=41988 RepID=A0A4Y8KLN5_9MICO|nr:glycine oxidase ThiO [Cryobacterium psychrophilum]TDW26961.1 glycine oxidase [Cryobacterium psychrophilum]TFD75363.1 glycine oxidase ThiO [Cryobacterium psychrophilum]